MTTQCTATKRDVTPCRGTSTGPHGLCWVHDAKNAERRRRGQSRGGRNKSSRELTDLKARLLALADDVLAGQVDRADASVVGQLLNTVIRAVSVESKVREVEDLEARLDALERAAEDQRGGRKWGA